MTVSGRIRSPADNASEGWLVSAAIDPITPYVRGLVSLLFGQLGSRKPSIVKKASLFQHTDCVLYMSLSSPTDAKHGCLL